ncbi:MAG: translation initiation factor IF-2, partial [Deltaproteobacteria bacterium]|nr:translation initiation factor IF-2 [Deltaproteobacteria bacterium]
PITREEVVGHAEIKSVFSATKTSRIAGGIITDGKVERNSLVRLYRDNVLLHSGTLSSLRRFKDDVNQVSAGQEFGFMLANFTDVKEGDLLEVFVRIQETPTLERGGRSGA